MSLVDKVEEDEMTHEECFGLLKKISGYGIEPDGLACILCNNREDITRLLTNKSLMVDLLEGSSDTTMLTSDEAGSMFMEVLKKNTAKEN